MKKFAHWPLVKRSYASKGIADIIAIRELTTYDGNGETTCPQVVFIQCKFSRKVMYMCRCDTKPLENLAKQCGAIPIWAFNEGHKIRLWDLRKDLDELGCYFDPT